MSAALTPCLLSPKKKELQANIVPRSKRCQELLGKESGELFQLVDIPGKKARLGKTVLSLGAALWRRYVSKRPSRSSET
jgi:hypothetical protein